MNGQLNHSIEELLLCDPRHTAYPNIYFLPVCLKSNFSGKRLSFVCITQHLVQYGLSQLGPLDYGIAHNSILKCVNST